MMRIAYSLFLCVCFLPTIGNGADDSQKTYLIAKEKLGCLYKQTDSLLRKGIDPVLVLLSSQCTRLPAQLESRERRLPVPRPAIGEESTFDLSDMLVLSRAQLRCFQRGFEKLTKQREDPLSVRFADDC